MGLLEVTALVSTIVCVILSGKEKVLAWPIGIISAISLILVYIPQHMYANIVLQTIFVLQCSIGWYNWGKKDDLRVSKVSKFVSIRDIMAFIIIGCVYAAINDTLNSEGVRFTSYLDGISTTLALLGNWYLTKKKIQAWPLFITYNFIIAFLFAIQEMYIFSLLNLCLLCISLNSFYIWKRNLAKV